MASRGPIRGRPVLHDGVLDFGAGILPMHDFGIDRQFRGEIRAVRIFGSRTGPRGAMGLDEIRRHVP